MIQESIAVDFDGVVHNYSRGWQGGEIYDSGKENWVKSITEMIEDGKSVFIFTAREDLWAVANWCQNESGIPFCVIPEGVRFWTITHVVGVTNRKLPATAYIDDRAVVFENWTKTMMELKQRGIISTFK